VLMSTYVIYSVLYRISLINITIGSVLSEIAEYILPVVIGIDVTAVGGSILFDNCQWMMIFALPFVLNYNGQKGRGFKKLFYMLYPIHIIMLWGLQFLS